MRGGIAAALASAPIAVIDQHRVPVPLARASSAQMRRERASTSAPQRVSRRSISAASMPAGATISTARPARSGGAAPARPRCRPRGSGTMARKVEPCARRALDLDAAAHALDDAARDGEAQAGAAELPRRAAVGLLELVEDAGLLLRRDADAGVAHLEHDLAGAGPGLDDDADAAGLGELDGVAGEIEQHLAQPRGVADDALRQPLVDVGGDLEALGLGARARAARPRPRPAPASENGCGSSSSLPASILEKSRISSISDSSASPEVLVALT